MPNIDLSILNQRQTPAFYADVFANLPAAGFVGRIFVSTDTFAFYRDNGTGWDLIGGPGTGTVTGTGAAGQVAFWSGSSLITGENNLWWDSTNNHFGINTNTPGTALDIHHDQNTLVQLNQTTAANDTRIAFQNSGVSLWRIGNFYNAGANDWGIYDVVGSAQPLTIKKTTGQVLIGTSTVGSGKLVVASATGDNGVQIVGASAPSLRIDNAESGPTKRVGLGISTAVNNFIQGSADRDFCMFNGSTTASPILFGIYGTTNVQEAARISAARNFLVGTVTDGGQRLQISGNGYFSNNQTDLLINITDTAQFSRLAFQENNVDKSAIQYVGSTFSTAIRSNKLEIYSNGGINFITKNTLGTPDMIFSNTGDLSIGTTTTNTNSLIREILLNQSITNGVSRIALKTDYNTQSAQISISSYLGENLMAIGTISNSPILFNTNNVERYRVTTSGNLLIGTTTDAGQKLQVSGEIFASNTISSVRSNSGGDGGILFVKNSGGLILGNTAVLAFATDSGGTITNNPRIQAIATNASDGASSLEFYVHAGAGVVNKCLTMKSTRVINISSIPTSAVGLSSGDIYSNLGVLTIV